MVGILGYEKFRREPVTPPVSTPPQLNVRPILTVYPQDFPDQPRDTDIASRPSRMPIAVFQSVNEIEAVWADEFLDDTKIVPDYSAAVNYSFAGGGQGSNMVQPWTDRSNIVRVEPTPYGSHFVTDDQYQLLIGVA